MQMTLGMDRRHRVVADKLLDVLIATLYADRIPREMGRRIADMYQSGEIWSLKGFRLLRKACMLTEPDKTKRVLRIGKDA
jgi:hypothetical protein